jgi:hypothetical protein
VKDTNEAPVQSVVLYLLGPISDIEFGLRGFVASSAVGMQIRRCCFVRMDLWALNQTTAVWVLRTREVLILGPVSTISDGRDSAKQTMSLVNVD